MLGLPSLKFSSPTIFHISLSGYSIILVAPTKILGIILDSHPLSYSPSNSTSNKWAENLVTYHTYSIILPWFKSPQPLLKLVYTVLAPFATLYSTKHSDWSLWNRNQITSFHSSNLPWLFLSFNSLTISSQNERNSPTLLPSNIPSYLCDPVSYYSLPLIHTILITSASPWFLAKMSQKGTTSGPLYLLFSIPRKLFLQINSFFIS